MMNNDVEAIDVNQPQRLLSDLSLSKHQVPRLPSCHNPDDGNKKDFRGFYTVTIVCDRWASPIFCPWADEGLIHGRIQSILFCFFS